MPVENFLAAVDRYNGMYDNGEDIDYGVPSQFLSSQLVDEALAKDMVITELDYE